MTDTKNIMALIGEVMEADTLLRAKAASLHLEYNEYASEIDMAAPKLAKALKVVVDELLEEASSNLWAEQLLAEISKIVGGGDE